jgi:hypothetical protein
METFVAEIVVVPLFTTILVSDFSSAFMASAFFRRLFLITSGGTNRFALIYASFASETALCGPLIGPGHLFVLFPTFYNYFRIVLVCFGSIVGEHPPPPPFIIFMIVLSFFLLDQEWK